MHLPQAKTKNKKKLNSLLCKLRGRNDNLKVVSKSMKNLIPTVHQGCRVTKIVYIYKTGFKAIATEQENIPLGHINNKHRENIRLQGKEI